MEPAGVSDVPPPFNYRQVLLIGAVLGLVAAGVVWWLERFELQKVRDEIRETMAGEASRYLENYDRFQQWLREHGRQPD